jgi:hypothetical protein
MAQKRKPTDAEKTQSQRFIEAARELGCDDSEERFREVVGKLAKAPPAPGPSKAKKPKSLTQKFTLDSNTLRACVRGA